MTNIYGIKRKCEFQTNNLSKRNFILPHYGNLEVELTVLRPTG